MFSENGFRHFQIGSFGRNNEFFLSHYLADFPLPVFFKTQVAVRENPYKFLVIIDNRDAADFIFFHERKRIFNRGLGVKSNRVYDEPAFTSFYFSDLLNLFIDRHVFMKNAHATFACQRDRQGCFRNRVHSRGKQWNI